MNNAYNEEARLIKSCKKGDLTALAQIARLHKTFLTQTAFSLLGNRESAEELVLITLMTFWNKRKSLKADTTLKTYFCNSLYTVARDHPDRFDLGIKRKLEMAMLHSATISGVIQHMTESESRMTLAG